MNTRRKLVWTVLMLLVVALAMSPVADAKGGGNVQLRRGASDLRPGGGSTSFGNPSSAVTADVCSGWCNCSYCECSGTLSCCIGGCEACWDYRDGQGLCNVT